MRKSETQNETCLLPSRSTWLIIVITLVLTPKLFAQKGKDYIFLPTATVVDKIRGGMLGQMLGNLNGLPHEMKYVDQPGNVTNYTPSLPEGAWSDDDTDFEWVYVVEMQKNRTAMLPHDTIYAFWKERINKRVWCSNLYARCLMDIGIKPPYTGNGTLNPWANFNISGQFLSETFGLMAPAMPQTAARIGLNYTTVAIDNEPAQSTQLFTTMVSMAFIETDINRILDAGLMALDERSVLREVTRDVRAWHRAHPDNWRETRKLLRDKYTQEGGNFRDVNGFELNTGSIIASMLYGRGDFSESLKHAFNFGWDADCNAATVGTIVGVMRGYRSMMSHNDPYDPDWLIVDRYRNVTRDNMPMNETITSFADRVVELFEMINGEQGGLQVIEDNIRGYRIPAEPPSPVRPLTSVADQKTMLQAELKESIRKDLLSDERERMARAVYTAVCLETYEDLKNQYPKQWRKGCEQLGGYWKIMNNVFSKRHDFAELKRIQEKFIRAGFRSPVADYTNQELWNDRVLWKDPTEIYHLKK